MNNFIRAEFTVEGLVQGVGFRYFVYQQAKSLGLNGFVQNRWDGNVYTVVEGDKPVIELFRKSLERGPMMAHVISVKSDYSIPTLEFDNFEIR